MLLYVIDVASNCNKQDASVYIIYTYFSHSPYDCYTCWLKWNVKDQGIVLQWPVGTDDSIVYYWATMMSNIGCPRCSFTLTQNKRKLQSKINNKISSSGTGESTQRERNALFLFSIVHFTAILVQRSFWFLCLF